MPVKPATMGLGMERRYGHRGIAFSVRKAGNCQWQWKLIPPDSVAGLWSEHGMVIGEARQAIDEARRAIERQTRKYYSGFPAYSGREDRQLRVRSSEIGACPKMLSRRDKC
jgi:hypothetical protein